MTDSADGTVDFHFDILCPFAYQTSLWIRRVRDQNGLTISWRFFSLEEVNHVEGSKHPWERDWSYGWSLLRIAALLRRTSMDDVDRWYERAGRALRPGRRQSPKMGLYPTNSDASPPPETQLPSPPYYMIECPHSALLRQVFSHRVPMSPRGSQ